MSLVHSISKVEMSYMRQRGHIYQNRGLEPWTKLSLKSGLTEKIKAGMGVQRLV